MAAPKSREGPAQRAELMPGAPSSASTQRPRIVGKRGDVCAIGSGARLDFRICDESSAGFFRLRQAEICRRNRCHSIGSKEVPHLSEFARIMRRDHEFTDKLLRHEIP